MIAVTFAVTHESRDFRAALRQARRIGPAESGWLRGRVGTVEVLLAHFGVGAAAAERNGAALLAAQRPEFLIAGGFAGGLDPTLKLGDLVFATNFSAPALLERSRTVELPGSRAFFAPLVTVPTPVESFAAKAALAAATGAAAVDMETAPLAAACAAAGVPFLAVRTISDPAAAPLPVPFGEWFDLARQRPRHFALLSYLARHPTRIAPFAHFVRGLPIARASLTRFLLRFLAP